MNRRRRRVYPPHTAFCAELCALGLPLFGLLKKIFEFVTVEKTGRGKIRPAPTAGVHQTGCFLRLIT